MTLYRPRELTHLVAEALKTLPVVVITGLRQAGKTTFLRHQPIFEGYRYFTLDDFATLETARRSPEAFLEGNEPTIIDEAQRCPELFLAVKRAVDRRREPGRLVLSGSANLNLLEGVNETLAGRALYLDLHPFTRRERLRRLDRRPFLVSFLENPESLEELAEEAGEIEPLSDEEILDGGMPPIVAGEAANRGLWFLGYEQTYLERDVRSLVQVADLVAFRNLLRLAAHRTGQLFNQSEIARDAHMPVSTASRYLGVLETSFVLSRLAPHLRSRATRLIKSPKLFVTDSGLAAHLTEVEDLDPGSEPLLRGALYETFVHQNLAGILSAHLPRAELTFWSVQGRHEVDFVVTSARRSVAIEVKAATRFRDRELSGLRAFKSKTKGVVAGILAYNGREIAHLGDGLWALPLGLLLG